MHAAFSIHLRADQVVSGTAVNFLALGITGYIFIDHYGDNGTPDNISRVPDVNLPILNGGFLDGAIGQHEPADVAGAADGPGADLLPVPHAPRTAAARGRREAARRGHRRAST